MALQSGLKSRTCAYGAHHFGRGPCSGFVGISLSRDVRGGESHRQVISLSSGYLIARLDGGHRMHAIGIMNVPSSGLDARTPMGGEILARVGFPPVLADLHFSMQDMQRGGSLLYLG